MLPRLRKHITYANVMATIAVFLALGGTTIAASRVLVKKSGQLKNGVVTNKKIKKGTIGLDRLSAGARGALAGKQGPAGAAGAAGLVRAYGHILNDGSLDPNKSHAGIVSSRRDGSYMCVKLDPSIDAANATAVAGEDLGNGTTTFTSPPSSTGWVQIMDSTSCTGGNEIRVAVGSLTFGADGTGIANAITPSGFYVLVP